VVKIESLRLRYFPFSYRLTLRFCDVRQHVEIVQLVQHLSNDLSMMSTPRSKRRDARVCRSVCYLTPSMPAFLQASSSPRH
jgi:hypothetical protein